MLLLCATQAWASCFVVLVPGAFAPGSTGLFLKPKAYFADYESFLHTQGCKTRKVEFPVDVTIEVRARILRDVVEKTVGENGGTPVVLIAHSQGGLDSRYALKSLDLKGVSALLTIGVPHHGTPIANWVLSHRGSMSPLYWFLRIFGNYDLRQLSFVGEMTQSFLQQHAQDFAAVPGVRYASARGVCRTVCHWSLRLLDWLSGSGGIGTAHPGDGLIPASSQSFGTDLGTYDLDHISEVDNDPYKRAERQRLFKAFIPYLH